MRSFSDGHYLSSNESSFRTVQGPRPYNPTPRPSGPNTPLRINKQRSVSEGRSRISAFAKGLFRRSANLDDEDVDDSTNPQTPPNNKPVADPGPSHQHELPSISPDTPPDVRARVEPTTPTRRKTLSIKTSFFTNLFPRQVGRQFSGQSIASVSTVDGESPITPTQGPIDSQLPLDAIHDRKQYPLSRGPSILRVGTTIRTSSGSYENRDDYNDEDDEDSESRHEISFSDLHPQASQEKEQATSQFGLATYGPVVAEPQLAQALALSMEKDGEFIRRDVQIPSDPFSDYTVGPSKESFWASSLVKDGKIVGGSLCATNASLVSYNEATIRFVSDLHTPKFAPNLFNVPEIVSLIIQHLDAMTPVPHEVAPKRRKPMSWRHAMLLYGNRSTAWQAINETDGATELPGPTFSAPFTLFDDEAASPLLSCMLVNHIWYEETCRILYKHLHFSDSSLFAKFSECNGHRSKAVPWGSTSAPGPRLLVLHKLTETTQDQVDNIAQDVGGNLEWLEFYTCPNLYPSRELMRGGTLKKVVVPGCTAVNDSVVGAIARACPLLEQLDLRACEEVSDKSIRVVAHYCRNLAMLNVGRTHCGHRITNRGIRSIARHTKITTLGVAGCHINDTTIWELAIHRGRYLERLSLNNCFLLTNNSVPRILGYTTKNLSVLELRGCPLISNMMPLVIFKRYKQARQGFAPLIEGCELFESRMREAEYTLEMEISKQIFKDTLEWIYGPDSDVEYVAPPRPARSVASRVEHPHQPFLQMF